MDVEHERYGDTIITLSETDIEMLKSTGSCMGDSGLEGEESSTWIQGRMDVDKPLATVDDLANMHVYLPEGDNQLPTRIGRNAIGSIYYNEVRSQVERYFGRYGGIIIRAAEA